MSAASAPIRTGLIGYGFAGRTFHAPLIAAERGLALTLVASRHADKVRADLPGIAVIADPLAAIASDAVDLIVIATPNDTHAPLARAALQAGKHVVVDKPFTLDLAEARALSALAEAAGRHLAVFQNRRWDSDFLSVSRAITEGRIGAVAHFESHFDRFRPAVRDRWREGAGPGAGIWFDLGPHLVDQALLLFGPPRRVTASIRRQRDGALADDWAHVLLDHGAVQSVLHASMLVAGGVNRFTVHGTGGSLVKRGADLQESQLLAGMRPGAAGWGADPDPLILFNGEGEAREQAALPGDQRGFYAAVAAAILGEGANPVPPVQAVVAMAVIEAAIESARTGMAVEPALTPAEVAAWQAVHAR